MIHNKIDEVRLVICGDGKSVDIEQNESVYQAASDGRVCAVHGLSKGYEPMV